MDYTPLSEIPYYKECEPLVSGLGYSLVSVKVTPMKGRTQVQAVIAFKDSVTEGIGIDDCAKVHRLLAPRMEAVLHDQDIYMEVTSPGMERMIKNAAEFALFTGRDVKVYSTEITEWIAGKIKEADESRLVLILNDEKNSEKTVQYTKIAKAKLLEC